MLMTSIKFTVKDTEMIRYNEPLNKGRYRYETNQSMQISPIRGAAFKSIFK